MTHTLRVAAVLSVAVLALFGAGVRATGTPTPLPVPTITADGCDRLDEYRAEMAPVLADLRRIMRDVPEDDAGFLLTSGEMRALTDRIEVLVDRLDAINAPPVARPYHANFTDLVRLYATYFREAATAGFFIAAAATDEPTKQLDAQGEAIIDATIAVCPAFAAVVGRPLPGWAITPPSGRPTPLPTPTR